MLPGGTFVPVVVQPAPVVVQALPKGGLTMIAGVAGAGGPTLTGGCARKSSAAGLPGVKVTTTSLTTVTGTTVTWTVSVPAFLEVRFALARPVESVWQLLTQVKVSLAALVE